MFIILLVLKVKHRRIKNFLHITIGARTRPRAPQQNATLQSIHKEQKQNMLLQIQYTTDKFDSSFTEEQLVQLASSATQDKTTPGGNWRSRDAPPCVGLVTPIAMQTETNSRGRVMCARDHPSPSRNTMTHTDANRRVCASKSLEQGLHVISND